MDTLKEYAVEAVATVWLVLVAVEYLSRYFIGGLDLDLSPAYLVMLCLIVLAAGFRGLRAIRSRSGRDD